MPRLAGRAIRELLEVANEMGLVGVPVFIGQFGQALVRVEHQQAAIIIDSYEFRTRGDGEFY